VIPEGDKWKAQLRLDDLYSGHSTLNIQSSKSHLAEHNVGQVGNGIKLNPITTLNSLHKYAFQD
jgi:hypothetical protein